MPGIYFLSIKNNKNGSTNSLTLYIATDAGCRQSGYPKKGVAEELKNRLVDHSAMVPPADVVIEQSTGSSLYSEDEHMENASLTDLGLDDELGDNDSVEAIIMNTSSTVPVEIAKQSNHQHIRENKISRRGIQSQILDEIAIHPGKFIIALGLVPLLISLGGHFFLRQHHSTMVALQGEKSIMVYNKLLDDVGVNGILKVDQRPADDSNRGGLYTLIKRLENELTHVQHRLELAESRIEVLEEDVVNLKRQNYGNSHKQYGDINSKMNGSLLQAPQHKALLKASALTESQSSVHNECRDPRKGAVVRQETSLILH